MIDLNRFGLRPVPWMTAPSLWILLSCFFIGLLTAEAYFFRLAIVPLIGRHILDATVSVIVVVPVDKPVNPGSD